jgi:hypothetical protein
MAVLMDETAKEDRFGDTKVTSKNVPFFEIVSRSGRAAYCETALCEQLACRYGSGLRFT